MCDAAPRMPSSSVAPFLWPFTLQQSTPSSSSKANLSGASSVSQRGREHLAQEVLVLLLGREDLVLLVQPLALELDALLRPEDVLELLEHPEAELAIRVELRQAVAALRDIRHRDREVVIGLVASLS
jgi:hypothetical protein